MARGGRVQARDKAESTSLADATEGTSEGPVAENTQTMQAFLGYFHPTQAERMAWGCSGDAGHEPSGAKDQAADEWLLQALPALQAAIQHGKIAIEEALAEGDALAVRLAVPNLQLQSSRVVERALYPSAFRQPDARTPDAARRARRSATAGRWAQTEPDWRGIAPGAVEKFPAGDRFPGS